LTKSLKALTKSSNVRQDYQKFGQITKTFAKLPKIWQNYHAQTFSSTLTSLSL